MPKILDPLRVPPGKPGVPYTLEYLCGEVIYLPCTKSVFRLLVTGRESDDAFAVLGNGGVGNNPIGFHYHHHAHDVFLVVKGSINVWAGDQCRTLHAGDYASVPPGIIHQYQVLGDYSEFLSLIVPGGWEDFFRVIGEPYSRPLFSLHDDRKFAEYLEPRITEAAKTFDVIRLPNHPYFGPQDWSADKDVLPGKLEPYFLKAGTSARYLIGGAVCSLIGGVKESAGRFEVGTVEGSGWHEDSVLSTTFKFDKVHHAISVVDGSVEATISGDQVAKLATGETAYVPCQTSFSLRFVSRYAKIIVWTSGGGLVGLLCKTGRSYTDTVPPETSEAWDRDAFIDLQAELGFKVVEQPS